MWHLDGEGRDGAVNTMPPGIPHYHGGVLHEHPGGDIPHEHPGPGRSLGSELGFGLALGIGIGVALLGIFGVLLESANHSACNSGLVQAVAPDQCGAANFIWTLGVIGIVVGIVVVLGAIIVRTRRPAE